MKAVIISVYVLLFSLSSCSQTKNKENIEEIAVKIDTYINNIFKKVKHHSEELVYLVSASSPGSYFQIKLNDILIQECFIHDESSYPITFYSNVNCALKEKGKQKLNYKFFPSRAITFKENNWIEISIKTNDQFGEKNTITTFEPSMKEDGETSEHIGLESYSGEFEFEASLPYKKQIDWSESEILIDQKNIEQEVLEAYKEVMRLYAEGDLDTLLELYKPIFIDEAQSIYATKEEKYRSSYELSIERLHPFFYKSNPSLAKDYELKYYADGKLVTLEKKKTKIKSHSESALSIAYDKDFNKLPDGLEVNAKHLSMFEKGIVPKMEMELYLFFHKPKGSKTLKLATDIFREEKLLNPVD